MKPEAALAKLLGGPPPDAVGALPAETLERLTRQISSAKKSLATEIEEAVQTAIAGVPFAVRGIVKKALQ